MRARTKQLLADPKIIDNTMIEISPIMIVVIFVLLAACKEPEPVATQTASDSFFVESDSVRTLFDLNDSTGISRGYFPDKKLQWIISYDKGKRDGISLSHFQNGKWESAGQYRQGVLEGKLLGFFPNGRLSVLREQIDSHFSESLTYGPNSEQEFYKLYYDDKLIYSVVYDSLKPCLQVEEGQPIWTKALENDSDSIVFVFARLPYYEFRFAIVYLPADQRPTNTLAYSSFSDDGGCKYSYPIDPGLLDAPHVNVVLQRISLICHDTSYFYSGDIVFPDFQ